MSVLTEAKIRKLFRQSKILAHGTFSLSPQDKLTPAARSFLQDHHVQVLVCASSAARTEGTASRAKRAVTSFEDSLIYPLLFKLTRLYPYFLASQKAFHETFQLDKCQQMGQLLSVIENLLGYRLLSDLSAYQPDLPSHADLQAIRIGKNLDQTSLLVSHQEPTWRLTVYQAYLETQILRKEFELVGLGQAGQDEFADQVIQLFKSIEVLLWLMVSD